MKIFNCIGCDHAVLENGVQAECQLGLLKKHQASDITDGYFDLNRVCLSKTGVEINIPFGYVFILKDINQKETLFNNIRAIKNSNPIWLGISADFPEIGTEISQEVAKILPDTKFNLVCHYSPIDDFAKLDRYKKDLKNAWTYVNIVGEFFNPNVKEVVVNYLIQNSGATGIIKDDKSGEDENVNNMCFFNVFYTFLKGSVPEVDEENQMLIGKTFYQKVFEKDPTMIKTWSEL